MNVAFPTTSSALVQLGKADYDIAQLSKKVDEVVKASAAGSGNSDRTVLPDTGDSGLAPSGQQEAQSGPDSYVPNADTLFHLHSLTLELALEPPPQHVRRYQREANEYAMVVNEDWTRHNTLLTTIKENFEPLVPFDLVAPDFGAIHKPVDARGLAKVKATGFEYLLPSKLQRRNVKPILKKLVYPYDQYGKEWFINSNSWDCENWIHAAIAMDPRQPQTRKSAYRTEWQRVYLRSGMKACWEPVDGGGDEDSALKLILVIDCFLHPGRMWHPLPPLGNDLIGLILHSTLPSPAPTPSHSDSERRADALRHFLSCLQPAPPVPHARSIQPSNMVSKLLPFQNRTVAWLLQRERYGTGSHDQGSSKDTGGFWSAYNAGPMGKVAFNRSTGQLVKLSSVEMVVNRKGKGKMQEEPDGLGLVSQDRLALPNVVDLSSVKGSMLCEEMGLGKTVEAIALILLHRHSLSTKRDDTKLLAELEMREQFAKLDPTASPTGPRGTRAATGRRTTKADKLKESIIDLSKELDLSYSSVMSQWWQSEREAFKTATVHDPVADLQVNQVAATLIVTPPSLLKQWISEMATHAPSLRVCVYTGWKTLLEGVDRRTNSDAKERKAKDKAKRKKENDRVRAQTVQKYRKNASGNRVKMESDYSDMDSDDEDEDDDELGESLQQRTQKLFVDYVRAHDVVIATYNDIAKDLVVANHAPPRSRRGNVDYRTGDRPRSPLVMLVWWRVIMDEVQLCGDTSAAANMVSLIPREHSLAVSGTPAKTDIKDLLGSLRFLRVPVLPFDHRLWHRLQQSAMRPAFDALFKTIATRMVVPVQLSEIEMHYYNDTLERQRVVLGLPADPTAPRPDEWYLDKALFRSCLQNLRQICTHIQVGQMVGGVGPRGRTDRLRLGKEILGLREVLKRMKEDNAAEVMLASRAQLRAMIRKARLTIFDEENPSRHLAALALYQRVRERAQHVLTSLREQLATMLRDREDSLDDGLLDENDGDSDDSDAAQPLTQQQREQRLERQHVRLSIREVLLILHQSWFFEGDVHHVRKEVDEEVNCYHEAEIVRKELFAGPLALANASIVNLDRKLQALHAIRSEQDLQTNNTDRRSGISSREVITQTNDLLKIMNENAVLVFNWRAKIVELLTSPIETEKDLPAAAEGQDVEDPEKEYYAQALNAQGQVEAYMFAYAAAIADRREMMLEERSLLAKHDARITKHRTTKRAAQALADSDILPNVPDDVAEQAAVLMAERQALKDARELKDCEKPLKANLMVLNTIVHGNYRPEEVAIAQRAINELKQYIATQSDFVDKLNKELDVFRVTFNRRVTYFAAYQNVSDSVTPPTYKVLAEEIKEASEEIVAHETRLGQCQVKSRYLHYLGTKQESDDDLKDDCIICFGSSDDEDGVLLQCGHFFCTSCYNEYRKTTMGSRCPNCRTQIDEREATAFRMAPKAEDGTKTTTVVEALVPAEGVGESSTAIPEEVVLTDLPLAVVEQHKRQADLERLNNMPDGNAAAIQSMDMMGEYGSKINFLIKHLLYYRVKDESARHVVFSNWHDSLRIVIEALKANGISYVAFDKGGMSGGDIVDKFHKDTSISVFLLHAEKESAGLTLTSCRVVHLLEPVLKHSFELQAIGRVDRLGQKEETTVYCYSTRDTVESRILSQGVRNGTSIYLKDEEQGDQVVEDMDNVASAAHKGGDIGVDGNEEEMLQLIML